MLFLRCVLCATLPCPTETDTLTVGLCALLSVSPFVGYVKRLWKTETLIQLRFFAAIVFSTLTVFSA
jgi:hypothetical protein